MKFFKQCLNLNKTLSNIKFETTTNLCLQPNPENFYYLAQVLLTWVASEYGVDESQVTRAEPNTSLGRRPPDEGYIAASLLQSLALGDSSNRDHNQNDHQLSSQPRVSGRSIQLAQSQCVHELIM